MKKRNQKLSLHRETVAHLENLPAAKLDRVAGGVVSSCGDRNCDCPDDFAPLM
jgi:hypothetical protein